MLKPVKSVIASARVLLRRPSEAKLPSEDMRLLLHQTLEELHAICLKENTDFFTHDLPIDLTYNEDSLGYTFSVDTHPGVSGGEVTDLIPVFLKYQPIADDPDEDKWERVQVQKLSNFGVGTSGGKVEAAMLGNSWQGITNPQFKLNVDQQFVTDHRWRICFRSFPGTLLDYDDTVPFPGEFTSLIEYMLASKALPLVRDDSPSWRTFAPGQASLLLLQTKNGLQSLKEWLSKDVDNHLITNQPYHYRYNNKLLGGNKGRFRTEW